MESRLFGIYRLALCCKAKDIDVGNEQFVICAGQTQLAFLNGLSNTVILLNLLQSKELWYNIMKTEFWTVSVDYHLTKNLALSYVNQRVYKTTSRFSFINHIIVRIEDNIFFTKLCFIKYFPSIN